VVFPGMLDFSWYAHLYFSHLTLSDYLTGAPIEEVAICPVDEVQIDRIDIPIGQNEPHEVFRRFESTYEVVPATHSVDQWRGSSSPGPNDVAPINQHMESPNSFIRNANYLVNRSFYEVGFPSSKVWMLDNVDRHSKVSDPIFFADDRARTTLLFFDGSVSRRATRSANRGFQPLDPTSPEPTTLVVNQGQGETLEFDGVFRWTRGGLRGVDFGGDEISTGQP